jgi:hypothetical protein
MVRPIIPKKPISEYVDDRALANIMTNAKRNNNEDIWWQCWRRRCELKRIANTTKKTQLEKDFDGIMHGYEMLLSDLKKRKYRASRTWQMVGRRGVTAVLKKWAQSEQKEFGFTVLIEHDFPEWTGEYLVLQHPELFSSEVLAAARKSLLDAGVAEQRMPSLTV